MMSKAKFILSTNTEFNYSPEGRLGSVAVTGVVSGSGSIEESDIVSVSGSGTGKVTVVVSGSGSGTGTVGGVDSGKVGKVGGEPEEGETAEDDEYDDGYEDDELEVDGEEDDELEVDGEDDE